MPGWAMSKMDVTTQDLLLQLGPTSHTRSAKADAVFRRLRLEDANQIADKLMRAPRAFEAPKAKSQAPAKTNK